MKYLIRWCKDLDKLAIQKISKIHNVFVPAKFIVSDSSFKNTLYSKKIFLVAQSEKGQTVGYILSKMKTRGVCFNMLLAVDAEHRLRGIGGALIIAMLKIMNQKQFDGLDNPFFAYKWFAEVPAYNVEALQMYTALSFDVEGVLRRHTSAQTDIFMLGYFIDEKGIPEYGAHLTKHDPAEIDDCSVLNDAVNHIKKMERLKTKKGKKQIKGQQLVLKNEI